MISNEDRGELFPLSARPSDLRRGFGLGPNATFIVLFLVVPLAAYMLVTLPKGGGVGADDWLQPALLAALGLSVVAWLAYAQRRFARMLQPLPPIVLGVRSFSLPRPPFFDRVEEFPYENLQYAALAGRGRTSRVVLFTDSATIFFPGAVLAPPATADDLVDRLFVRAASVPVDGPRLSHRWREHERTTGRLLAARARATGILAIAILAAFAVELLYGAIEQPLLLITLGANVSTLVQQGEVHRLISSAFLHGSFPHLYLNLLALVSLGGVLEKLLGSTRFTLVFLVSAIAGSVASALLGPAMLSVGASTAILGLLGSFAVIHVRMARSLPLLVRQSRRWWVFIIGINCALPILVPQIDVFGHLGGFIGGAFITWVLVVRAGDAGLRPRPGPLTRGLTGLLCACSVLALIRTGVDAASPNDLRQQLAIAQTLNKAGFEHPFVLNVLAWTTAVSPEASVGELREGLTMAQRADELEPDNSAILDTLATVHYRLGELEQAISTERRALTLEDNGFYASQLARFLDRSPSQLDPGLQPDVRVDSGGIVLSPASTGDSQLTFDIVLRDRLGLRGLLRVREPGPEDRHDLVIPCSALSGVDDPSHLLLRFAAVPDEEHDSNREPGWHWRFWPYDPEVAPLP